MPRVKWDEATDGIENIDHRRLITFGMPNSTSEYRRKIVLASEGEHARSRGHDILP